MIDPRALATDELRPGEHLLWAGSSDPSVVFTRRDAFLVPFSLLWCGFVVFWITSAIQSGAPVFFVLFGSAFALIGLHLVIGRFLVKRHRKLTEAYAVTNRRVFITNGRQTRETSVSGTDRSVHWSKGRARCSVVWNGSAPSPFAFGFNGLGVQQMYANSGLDGFFGPRSIAFWDVSDGRELIKELDRAS